MQCKVIKTTISESLVTTCTVSAGTGSGCIAQEALLVMLVQQYNGDWWRIRRIRLSIKSKLTKSWSKYLINPFSSIYLGGGGWGGCQAYHSLSRLSRGWEDTLTRLAQGWDREIDSQSITSTPTGNLESPNNLTSMSLRNSEFLERTHTSTGRTCQVHTERPQPGPETRAFLLWGNIANHRTTMLPKIK